MKILVTGSTGFVGRALVPALAEQGHSGIATGREQPVNLPDGWVGRRRDQLLRSRGTEEAVDAVVHLEVKQHVFRVGPAEVAEFEAVNVGGTREWTEWASANDVRRFVFLSSIKAAQGGPGVHHESSPLNTESPYGRSKAAGEAVVRQWSDSDPRRSAFVLRPAPVYGPGNEANMAAFVQRVLSGRRCFVGDGGARKSIVSRHNLVAAVMFFLERSENGCSIWNVSDRELLSVKELATLVAEIGGCRPPRALPTGLAKLAAAVGDVVDGLAGASFPLTSMRLRSMEEDSIFPSDKLAAAGFRHPIGVREAIAEMVDWAKTLSAP